MSDTDERFTQQWVVVIVGCDPGGHYLIHCECDM